jgi:hypothetical protein
MATTWIVRPSAAPSSTAISSNEYAGPVSPTVSLALGGSSRQRAAARPTSRVATVGIRCDGAAEIVGKMPSCRAGASAIATFSWKYAARKVVRRQPAPERRSSSA